MKSLLIFVTIVTVTNSQPLANTLCTEEHITSCWAPINAYLDTVNEGATFQTQPLHQLTDDQLTEVCRVWTEASKQCFEGLLASESCHEDQQAEFEGSVKSLNYLCTDLNTYVGFKACLAGSEVQNLIQRCADAFDNDINDAVWDFDEHYDKNVCNAVGTAIKCIGAAVTKHCGEDSGNWFRRYREQELSPYYDHMHGCTDYGHCTVQNIDDCWSPVNIFLAQIGAPDINEMDFLYSSLSNTQITQFCLIYATQSSPCLANLTGTCDEFERHEFEGREESLDFLCNQGLQEFESHRSCFNSTPVIVGINKCFAQFNTDIDEAYYESTVEKWRKSYCRAIQNMITCDKTVVKHECGDQAGEWMQEYERRQLQPYLDGVNCSNVPDEKCTQSSIAHCWIPVDNYAASRGFINSHVLTTVIAFEEDQHVREYCRIYDQKVSDCLLDIRPFCSNADRKIFEGEEDAIDYLCQRSLEVFLRHRTCLAKNEVLDSINVCTMRFNSDLENANTNQQQCDAVHDSIACDKDAVTKHCNSEAGNFYQEYYKRSLEPYLDHIGCASPATNKGGLSSGQKAGIAIFVIIVLGVLCVAAIMGWHFYTKQKAAAKKRQEEQVTFDNPLGGGANGVRGANGAAVAGANGNMAAHAYEPYNMSQQQIPDDPYTNLEKLPESLGQPHGEEPQPAQTTRAASNPIYNIDLGKAAEYAEQHSKPAENVESTAGNNEPVNPGGVYVDMSNAGDLAC